MLKTSQCSFCKHLHRKPREQMTLWTCDAFQRGIPGELFLNKVPHDIPFEGDNGILFEHDGGPFGRDIQAMLHERIKWKAQGGREWWEDLS